MDEYIAQLIEEIKQFTKRMLDLQQILTAHENDTLLGLSEAERFVDGGKYSLEEILGIKKTKLPTNSKLNKNQRAVLALQIEKLLKAYHFELEFPDQYPYHLRYFFIRQLWKQKFDYYTVGTCHIEFCDYDNNNCPFEGYCKICDDWNENEWDQVLDEGPDAIEIIRPQKELSKSLTNDLPLN